MLLLFIIIIHCSNDIFPELLSQVQVQAVHIAIIIFKCVNVLRKSWRLLIIPISWWPTSYRKQPLLVSQKPFMSKVILLHLVMFCSVARTNKYCLPVGLSSVNWVTLPRCDDTSLLYKSTISDLSQKRSKELRPSESGSTRLSNRYIWQRGNRRYHSPSLRQIYWAGYSFPTSFQGSVCR